MSKTLLIPIKVYSVSDSDNPDFLHVKLQAIKEGLNLNDSNFLLEGMKTCKDTFKGKPLMCAFPKDYTNNDYKLGDGHNSELCWDDEENLFYYSYLNPDSERCIGIISSDGDITIENINGNNWICMEGLIFKKYNYELVKALNQTNKLINISVEIEVLDSYEQDGIEYIKTFHGDAVTVLAIDGSVNPGIPLANLKLKAFAESDKFARFKQSFNFAYTQNKIKDKSTRGDDKTMTATFENNENLFHGLSMNQLRDRIESALSQYTYVDRNGYEYGQYWIDDITESVVIVHDYSDGKEYSIPYSIDENGDITLDMNAKIEVEETYTPVSKFAEKKEVFLSKDKWGTGDILKVDKSKDVMSNASWGDINKTGLRNNILKASNYKTLVNDVYAQVLDGWEDSPSKNLKYPIMMISNGTVIYNSEALSSALGYAKAQNETEVVDKIEKIRKKLGLDTENKKEEHNMKQYIEEAKKAGFSFLGFENNSLVFAKDIKCEDDMEDEDYKKEKMSLFEVSVEFANKEFKSDDLKEKSLKMDLNEDYKKEVEALKEKYAKLEKDYADEKVKCAELSKKCSDNEEEIAKKDKEKEDLAKKVEESEVKYKEMEAKFTASETKITEVESKYTELQKSYADMINKQFVADTDKILQFSGLNLDETEITELQNMRNEGKFTSVEDFKKEVAYKQFVKKEKLNEESNKGLTFGLDKTQTQIPTIKNDFDKLAEEYGC